MPIRNKTFGHKKGFDITMAQNLTRTLLGHRLALCGMATSALVLGACDRERIRSHVDHPATHQSMKDSPAGASDTHTSKAPAVKAYVERVAAMPSAPAPTLKVVAPPPTVDPKTAGPKAANAAPSLPSAKGSTLVEAGKIEVAPPPVSRPAVTTPPAFVPPARLPLVATAPVAIPPVPPAPLPQRQPILGARSPEATQPVVVAPRPVGAATPPAPFATTPPSPLPGTAAPPPAAKSAAAPTAAPVPSAPPAATPTAPVASVLAPAATPPAAPAAPSTGQAPAVQPAAGPSTGAASALAKTIDEARGLFQSGEVIKARERLQAAGTASGNARNPDILLELARTYDPVYLDRLAKKDATANPGLARALYEQAASFGSSAAAFDLLQLRRALPEAR